jgi:hypothetical protein
MAMVALIGSAAAAQPAPAPVDPQVAAKPLPKLEARGAARGRLQQALNVLPPLLDRGPTAQRQDQECTASQQDRGGLTPPCETG